MRLLVTRPEPDAREQALELAGLGHEAVLQPLLEFEVLDFDPALFEAAHGLIVTSRNALRALSRKPVPESLLRRPVFCVGSETAAALAGRGFQTIAAVAETAEELAGKIVAAAGKPARLVHATGEHRAFDLGAALARDGIGVTVLPVYTMKARSAFDDEVAGQIGRSEIGGAILMSPRTAEIFLSLCARHDILDRARSLDYFCLAKSVANRLKGLDSERLHVAARPERAALLALLPSPSTHGQDPMRKDL